MIDDPIEIARRIHALHAWEAAYPYNWALKPRGLAIPYFCSAWRVDHDPIAIRFFLLEGWQTLHDFVHLRADHNYAFYLSPMELPHFEMVVSMTDEVGLFRHDPGFVPRELNDSEKPLVAKLLWEAYGVMMRLESDPKLVFRYADDTAMFARVETANGTWEDQPLTIPEPRTLVEKITFEKKDVARAKDLPFDAKESLEIDFRILPRWTTKEARARFAYGLLAIDSATGESVFNRKLSVRPDGGLQEMWESLPPLILQQMIARGRIAGEIKVSSARLFRLLRPIGIELPIKLSHHSSLPKLNAAYKRDFEQ